MAASRVHSSVVEHPSRSFDLAMLPIVWWDQNRMGEAGDAAWIRPTPAVSCAAIPGRRWEVLLTKHVVPFIAGR